MLKVTYSTNGIPNADNQSEELAIHLYENETEYSTSTDSLITAIRLAVTLGKIPHDEVVIIFKDEELTIDEVGNLKQFPKGFCDSERWMLHRMIKARSQRSKSTEGEQT